MKQMLLFPDPRPLAERLGREFFRSAPECAGVYLMRDAADAVLYVGKAKNLRKRLGSYRVANPDRMPRRHLRMLRAVVRIELRECADETSALASEAELLRALRPKFNRAGTWPGTPRFLVWRCVEGRLELTVKESPEEGWRAHGPLGGGAAVLRAVLARLLWLAVHPGAGVGELPAGWFGYRPKIKNSIHCGALLEPAVGQLETLLNGQVEEFCAWIRAQRAEAGDLFTATAVEGDLEHITTVFAPAPEHQNI